MKDCDEIKKFISLIVLEFLITTSVLAEGFKKNPELKIESLDPL